MAGPNGGITRRRAARWSACANGAGTRRGGRSTRGPTGAISGRKNARKCSLVASVIMVASAIEFEGTIAGVTFRKGKVDPEVVKAMVEPFANALVGLLKT